MMRSSATLARGGARASCCSCGSGRAGVFAASGRRFAERSGDSVRRQRQRARDELDLATLHGNILVWLNALATLREQASAVPSRVAEAAALLLASISTGRLRCGTVADWDAAPMESKGGAMATQLRTLGWNTWTVIFALLILLLAMVYFAY